MPITKLSYIRMLLVVTAAFSMASCSDSDDSTEQIPVPKVTLLASAGGMGDNGYNDLILDGIMDFVTANDVDFSIITPKDMNEAAECVSRWTSEKGEKSLLIMATDEYEPLLNDGLSVDDDSKSILLFESCIDSGKKNVYTFNIRRYGASFLCGRMADECKNACIIAAYKGDDILQSSVNGFSDGYADAADNALSTIYLADDAAGYNMPEKAYQVTKDLPWGAFVFPLAGGSNNGIYKYAREDLFTSILIAGMDVDCSKYSTRTPFSLTISIDRAITMFLNKWFEGAPMDSHQEYGLEDGFAEVKVNESFIDNCEIWEDFYEDPMYWQKKHDMYYQKAVEAERGYYEK